VVGKGNAPFSRSDVEQDESSNSFLEKEDKEERRSFDQGGFSKSLCRFRL
jgi:hypothetical protein